jgi:predicted Fe-S protein YdhL (DUF1289 family)
MVKCSGCGRPIEKVPNWMSEIKTEFVCNNCPNRQTKNIAFINLEPEAKAAAADPEVDVEEVADDE